MAVHSMHTVQQNSRLRVRGLRGEAPSACGAAWNPAEADAEIVAQAFYDTQAQN